jgi:hypothetical protein
MNKASSLIALILLCFSFFGHSQTLTFSRAIIVSNSVETVPAGKVWKLTSAYGEYQACAGYFNIDYNAYRYKQAIMTDFYINGVKITVERVNIYDNSVPHFSNNICTTGSSSSNQNWNYTVGNRSASPVIFPMWVPSGTTVNTGASTVKLSALEFNIVP